MNGRLVMRASAVVAGIVLSRTTGLDWFDVLSLASVMAIGALGWCLTRLEPGA